jgi:sulfoxide reductase heme-binding subunit YedZ
MFSFQSFKQGLLRFSRHLAFATVGTLIISFFANSVPEYETMARMSLGAAYAALIFLAATLLISPYYALRKKRIPLSSHLRRDLGIWTAIFALLHTYVGFQVYGSIRFMEYFIDRCDELNDTCIRVDLFGFANHTGLLAAIILLCLLLISNNLSIKILSAKRWQAIQKFAYLGAALSVVHGVFYQLLEERMLPLVLVFSVLVLVVVLIKAWSLLTARC